MKRVIIVSYLFPPYGGKAVQRASKLAKYLPDYGWEPIIFTMPLNEAKDSLDSTLFDELPSCVEIHRASFRNWWKFLPYDIRKYFYNPLPDKYIAWAKAVEDNLISLIQKTNADALISTSPSHSVQLIGLAAKEKTGIPWVADFRDQWTGHPDSSTKKNYKILRDMENRVLAQADALVGVVPCILRNFKDRVSADKLHLIENGYDEDDFSLIELDKPNVYSELRIGYNGSVSGYHDPAPFLSAVTELFDQGSVNSDKLSLTFTTDSISRKRFAPFSKLVRQGILKVCEYLPHRESLVRMAEMDISLLLVTRGRDIYSAKVFEYMYLGNPILSLSTPGDDLEDLIRKTNSGTVVDYRDNEAVKKTVLNLIDMKKRGKLSRISNNREEIFRFSRKKIAERFSEILVQISS